MSSPSTFCTSSLCCMESAFDSSDIGRYHKWGQREPFLGSTLWAEALAKSSWWLFGLGCLSGHLRCFCITLSRVNRLELSGQYITLSRDKMSWMTAAKGSWVRGHLAHVYVNRQASWLALCLTDLAEEQFTFALCRMANTQTQVHTSWWGEWLSHVQCTRGTGVVDDQTSIDSSDAHGTRKPLAWRSREAENSGSTASKEQVRHLSAALAPAWHQLSSFPRLLPCSSGCQVQLRHSSVDWRPSPLTRIMSRTNMTLNLDSKAPERQTDRWRRTGVRVDQWYNVQTSAPDVLAREQGTSTCFSSIIRRHPWNVVYHWWSQYGSICLAPSCYNWQTRENREQKHVYLPLSDFLLEGFLYYGSICFDKQKRRGYLPVYLLLSDILLERLSNSKGHCGSICTIAKKQSCRILVCSGETSNSCPTYNV